MKPDSWSRIFPRSCCLRPTLCEWSCSGERVVDRITATTGLTEIHMQTQKTKAEVGLSSARFTALKPAVRVDTDWKKTARIFPDEPSPFSIAAPSLPLAGCAQKSTRKSAATCKGRAVPCLAGPCVCRHLDQDERGGDHHKPARGVVREEVRVAGPRVYEQEAQHAPPLAVRGEAPHRPDQQAEEHGKAGVARDDEHHQHTEHGGCFGLVDQGEPLGQGHEAGIVERRDRQEGRGPPIPTFDLPSSEDRPKQKPPQHLHRGPVAKDKSSDPPEAYDLVVRGRREAEEGSAPHAALLAALEQVETHHHRRDGEQHGTAEDDE
mmetsp:Transcript_26928/g.84541  ORF Transcript_26928/g.84541 Transcript_26928/m.84541 type:complete len:321 (+) Transcript_26928:448-1410(+)